MQSGANCFPCTACCRAHRGKFYPAPPLCYTMASEHAIRVQSPPPPPPILDAEGPTATQQDKPSMRRRALLLSACLLSLGAVAAVGVFASRGATTPDPSPSTADDPRRVRHELQETPTPRVVNTGKYAWAPPAASDLARLDRALASLTKSFDANASMNTANVTEYSPGYATKLTLGTVHPTKE